MIRFLRSLLAKASGLEALERRLAAVEQRQRGIGRNIHDMAAAGLKQNRVLAGLVEDSRRGIEREASVARLH